MPTGSYIGVLGNAQNRSQRRSEELNAMLRMEQRQKQSETEELQAQQMQQEYYNKLNAVASQLLTGDKKAIQEKSLIMQKEIREKIKMYGGSYKKFMVNGGTSIMNDYTSSLLSSEEMSRYAENKENMVKILAAREKYGHRINDVDMYNLKQYQKTGKGKITYTGLLPEIEKPDPRMFEYGKKISDEEYLATGSNMMKVKAMMIQNGLYSEDTPISDTQALEYFKTLNISARGIDKTKMQMQAKAQENALKAQKNALDYQVKMTNAETARMNAEIAKIKMQKEMYGKDYKYNKSTGKWKKKVYASNELYDMSIKADKAQLKPSQVLEFARQGDAMEGIINQTGLQQAKVYGSEWNEVSYSHDIAEESGFIKNMISGGNGDEINNMIANSDLFGGNGYFKAVGFKTFDKKIDNKLLSATIGNYKLNDDSSIDWNPVSTSGDVFGANGSLISKSKTQQDAYSGNYKPLGLMKAFTVKTTEGGKTDGKESLLTLKYEEDGDGGFKLDEKGSEEIINGYKNGDNESTLKTVDVMALKNIETGEIFYQKVNLDSQQAKAAFDEAVSYNDVTDIVNRQNEKAKDNQYHLKMAKDKRDAVNLVLSNVEGYFDDMDSDYSKQTSIAYNTEKQQFLIPGTSGPKNVSFDLDNLMKSYYVAMSGVHENDFTKQNMNPAEREKLKGLPTFTGLISQNGFTFDLIDSGVFTKDEIQNWNGSALSLIDEYEKREIENVKRKYISEFSKQGLNPTDERVTSYISKIIKENAEDFDTWRKILKLNEYRK